jgi:hypothetical protein
MAKKYKPVGTPTIVLDEADFAFEDANGKTFKGSVTQGALDDLEQMLERPSIEPLDVFEAFKDQLYQIAYQLNDAGRKLRIDPPVVREVGLSLPDAPV